jgi:hypothetical protein
VLRERSICAGEEQQEREEDSRAARTLAFLGAV